MFSQRKKKLIMITVADFVFFIIYYYYYYFTEYKTVFIIGTFLRSTQCRFCVDIWTSKDSKTLLKTTHRQSTLFCPCPQVHPGAFYVHTKHSASSCILTLPSINRCTCAVNHTTFHSPRSFTFNSVRAPGESTQDVHILLESAISLSDSQWLNKYKALAQE